MIYRLEKKSNKSLEIGYEMEIEIQIYEILKEKLNSSQRK